MIVAESIGARIKENILGGSTIAISDDLFRSRKRSMCGTPHTVLGDLKNMPFRKVQTFGQDNKLGVRKTAETAQNNIRNMYSLLYKKQPRSTPTQYKKGGHISRGGAVHYIKKRLKSQHSSSSAVTVHKSCDIYTEIPSI